MADASLVVSSDVEKGGTWAGAIEQLKKLRLVRVYVRSTGTPQRGLDVLKSNGAILWPNPSTPDDLNQLLDASQEHSAEMQLPLAAQSSASPESAQSSMRVIKAEHDPERDVVNVPLDDYPSLTQTLSMQGYADRLIDAVRPVILDLAQQPIADTDLAEAIDIPKTLAKSWLERFVRDDVLEKHKKPIRYVIKESRFL